MLTLKQEICWSDKDFDSNGNIKISSLMYAFQDIAGDHAESLNVGFDDLIKNNSMWVITKLRFKVMGKVAAGRKYILQTFPRPRKGVTFYRDYYLHDIEGNEIARGTSHWSIVNFETRKVERVRFQFEGEFTENIAFEDDIAKFKVRDAEHISIHKVVESDLDRNQHTNNCRYGDMTESVIEKKDCYEFTLHFAMEALLGDEIHIYKKEGDNGETYVMGRLHDEDETLIFQAMITE